MNKKTMTRNVLLEAAQRIVDGRDVYSCSAIYFAGRDLPNYKLIKKAYQEFFEVSNARADFGEGPGNVKQGVQTDESQLARSLALLFFREYINDRL